MRTEFSGPLRVLLVAVAGAGIVTAGAHVTGGADVTRAGDFVRSSAAVQSLTSEWVCPGPLSADDKPAASASLLVATAPTAATAPTTSSEAASGSLKGGPLPAGKALSGLPEQGGAVSSAQLDEPRAIAVSGTGARATGTAVSQFTIDRTTGSQGMQLTGCGAPTSESWLIAGGGETGRLIHVALVNPADAPVSVDLEVHGAHGPVPSAGRAGVRVPAHGREVVALGTRGADFADVAVQVVAHDGAVAAWALDTWYEGETPVGSELTGPTSAPDDQQMIPGVSVARGTTPSVRVVVPGTDSAVVRIRAADTSGNLRFDDTTTVQPGAAGHLDLTGLPAGTYSVEVSADVPVVASAMTRSVASGAGDIAWTPSATPVDGATGVPVPPGQHAQLVLVPTDNETEVSVSTAAGRTDSRRIRLAAGRPTVVDVSGARSAFVRAEHGAFVSVLLVSGKGKDGGMIAAQSLAALPMRADVTDVASTND